MIASSDGRLASWECIGAFIKAVIAVNRRVIPPTAGCKDPSPEFGYESA
jgi:acyl transferase domain-containing protein